MPEKNLDNKSLAILGGLTWGVTYLASRGNTHSKCHERIATLAMGLEVTTVASGLGLLPRRIGLWSLGMTAACFMAVSLTDETIHKHFESGKGLTGKEDLLDLGSNLLADFKRHMVWGVKTVISKYSNI